MLRRLHYTAGPYENARGNYCQMGIYQAASQLRLCLSKMWECLSWGESQVVASAQCPNLDCILALYSGLAYSFSNLRDDYIMSEALGVLITWADDPSTQDVLTGNVSSVSEAVMRGGHAKFLRVVAILVGAPY